MPQADLQPLDRPATGSGSVSDSVFSARTLGLSHALSARGDLASTIAIRSAGTRRSMLDANRRPAPSVDVPARAVAS